MIKWLNAKVLPLALALLGPQLRVMAVWIVQKLLVTSRLDHTSLVKHLE
jgi:hypothetical protein